jgi:hypothetical protein
MGRLDVLGRHPGRSLGVLAALLVAGGAAIGSGAAFTTQTVNPDNVFSSGILHVSGSGGAVLDASGLVPGDTATGTVTIANDGSVDGSSWKLEQAVTGETAGSDPADASSTGNLSDVLQLTITDTTAGTQVYAGPVTGLSSADLPVVAKGTSHSYAFSVTLPAGTGNAYEGGSLTTSYTWSASAGS